jgi:hypothetical protein
MGTARFDDGTPDNLKIVAAGPVASWLWFCGVIYCRKALTDGFIPTAVVETLVRGLKQPLKHAAKLTEVRLWHEVEGGYSVHDYLDWNPTKAAMNEYRKADRDRKHKRHGIQEPVSSGIRPESDRNPNDGANAGAYAPHAGTKSESQSESKRVEVLNSEKSARETSVVSGASRNHGLIDGSSLRRHGMHAWCDWEREMCVTLGQHAQFKARLGTTDADDRLRAWYPTVVAGFAGREIGDPLFAFWDNAFAAWVGTVTSRPTATGSRTGDTMDAAKASLRGRIEQLEDGDEDRALTRRH